MANQERNVNFINTVRPLIMERENDKTLPFLIVCMNAAADYDASKTTSSDALYAIVNFIASGTDYPEVNNEIHGFFQSMMFSRWLRKYKNISDDIRAISDMIIKLLIEDRRMAEFTTDDSCKILRSLMNMASAAYPLLGLSFGYIGNCDLHGNQWDNRSWYIFTKLDQDGRQRTGAGSSASFGGVETQELGRLVIQAEKEFLSWCAALETKRQAVAA